MKFKVLIVLMLIGTLGKSLAARYVVPKDSVTDTKEVIDTDQVLDSLDNQATIITPTDSTHLPVGISVADLSDEEYHLPVYVPNVKIDSLLLQTNSLFIDLVFMGFPGKFELNPVPDFRSMYFNRKVGRIDSINCLRLKPETPFQIVTGLRQSARNLISAKAANLYIMNYEQLPDPEDIHSKVINNKPLRNVRFVDESKFQNATNTRKIVVKEPVFSPWTKKANAMLQFSQNVLSKNWYQGGNSTLSVLSVVNGQLNYDNKKNVVWENYGEWRMGFYAVNDSTAKRFLNVNDDVIKVNSKLGIKAGDNFYYSSAVDFSSQLLNNYKSYASTTLKANFLTPFRLNIGMGMDYKYKKLVSVMLAPVAYKYIYVRDTIKVSQNQFGIEKGKNYLSEIGSSLKVVNSYSPFRELQLDSRFNFYTNYTKVEIDWEVVANFTVNRFLSTRISLNPRYDNTIIGEKAGIQFKELMSFGFSYKLID